MAAYLFVDFAIYNNRGDSWRYLQFLENPESLFHKAFRVFLH